MSSLLDYLNSDILDWEQFVERMKVEQVAKNPQFTAKIVATKLPVLGWYIPTLRKLAKAVQKEKVLSVIDKIKVQNYEDTLLKALLMGRINDIDELMPRLNEFVLSIDNWSTCDLLCSELKIVKKHRLVFGDLIQSYINSGKEFVERVGIVLLLKYYLDDEYVAKTLALLKNKESSFYYVNMAIAWTFAEACVNSGGQILEFLKTYQNDIVVKMLVGKVRDSFRVDKEIKDKIRQNYA